MSADLEQFYQVFFEEAAELLAEMEKRLLGLDVAEPSLEDLNAIFRAAHSIKGGAGTFGFTDMAELTHVLESLLDRLRKGELAVKSEMIDVFLRAGDLLNGQLAGHRGEGKADTAAAAQVHAQLKALAAGDVAPALAPAVPEGEPAPAMAQAPQAPQTQRTAYRIQFSAQCVEPRIMEHLLADLRRQGELEILSAPELAPAQKKSRRKTTKPVALPAQDYSLRLTTGASEEDVWEALAFVIDPATLRIEAEAASSADIEIPATVEAAAATTGASDPGYGLFDEPPAVEAATNACVPEVPERSPGRRAADLTDEAVKIGRRQTDKVAVGAETSSIRVGVEKVDQLINLVGELVITQSMLAQTASQLDPVIFDKLMNGLNTLERNTRSLQEAVMSIRMMPISFVFSRFPRVVRDLAGKLGKQVELKTVGEGTELDKGLIEKIADPLTHLVRNSLDHGIERPEAREASGKSGKGTITLRAFHQGGNVVIEVSDDGAGLNRERILAKARENGMNVPDTLPDQEVWGLIFEAGFSTAEAVTDVSGRGVGMDVVKRNIQALGGRVEIDSAANVGTRISIRLPLTLAILDGLSVAVGSEIFIIPLSVIIESLQPRQEDVKTIAGSGRVVRVRGEYLPVVALHEIFHLQPRVTEVERGIVVILESEGRKTALFVDELVGQHQVVIKSLESNYRRVHGVSGATIMGDGKVALILDPVAIAKEVQGALIAAA